LKRDAVFGFVGKKFAVEDTTPVNGISLLRRYLIVEGTPAVEETCAVKQV